MAWYKSYGPKKSFDAFFRNGPHLQTGFFYNKFKISAKANLQREPELLS